MIMPIMGTNNSRLATMNAANALFPRVRQRVLGLLYGNPDRSFFTNEIISLAGSGSGAVQRELADLTAAGLLTLTAQGNQKQYRANRAAPVYDELRGLVLKTFGLGDVLRDALEPLAPKIDAAFVYGSVAKQEDTASSDVDVMIVSDDLGYAEIFGALEVASITLGRPVNPTVYTPAQFRKRARQDSVFITRVLEQPKIWLVGTQEMLDGQRA
ncbi:MAG: transcriptional regulator [Comamonadaceae bacterium]|nr:MAG: transcriptional regulator [Comamonadaceae bacterium]